MAKPPQKLLLPITLARAGWDLVRARADVEAVPYELTVPTADLHALLADAAGIALSPTPFGEAELRAAPKLRVVARIGVGYDAVDVPALTRRGIPLLVTGLANSPSVAEQALHMMLALAKRGASMDALVREGRWMDRLSHPGNLPDDLFGKNVLVVGFGRTGSRVAKMCRGLDMQVLVYDPYLPESLVRGAGCEPVTDLDAALARADFVTLHCPKTPETTGMFGSARLARMKPTAYLVNTARGGIIDEAALHEALTHDRLQGAGLDVYEREPTPPENPLLASPKVLSAPHMAGVTRESMDRMAITTANNLLGGIDGVPNADNVINKQVLAAHR
jgi:D-3-phosphoglycerate dehydrogenase / 2-oxoglutarate reductase